MSAADLALVCRLLDGTYCVAPKTSGGFYNLLAGHRIAISPARGQLLRFRLRPEILDNGIYFGGIPLVPVSIPRIAAVIRVPPELRHARLRLEVLRIGQPFPHPLLAELSRNGREIGTHLADIFVTRKFVTAETSVDADQIAPAVENSRLRHFRTGVMTLVAARLNIVHRQHRRLEKFLFVPVVFLLPFFALVFTPRHMPGILETSGAIQARMTCRAPESFHRMRR